MSAGSRARPASTVMLLRSGADGELEVFMVQRHRRSGFLPHAWVFPGGRVDAGDHLHGHPRVRGGARIGPAFGVEEPLGVAHAVAGARETFEEAGLWLGEGALPSVLRDPLNHGAVALAEVLEAHDARLDLDALVPWSWWVTPEVEPKRYDTRFFAVAVPPGEARHDEREVVDSRWVSPRRVLEEADQAGFPLAPPTWWSLRELSAFGTVEDALAAPRSAHEPLQPVMQFETEGMRLLMPGHPEHGAPPIAGIPDRITWEGTWVAWRGAERLPPTGVEN